MLHEERLPNRNTAADAASAWVETKDAPLLADEEAALRWEEEHYAWTGRHGLRSAREGGVFPNVFFRRLRDRVEVSWYDEPLPGAEDVRFQARRGAAVLMPEEVASTLFEAVSGAVNALLGRRPQSERLVRLAARCADLGGSSKSRRSTRLGWLAGLPDPP